MFNKDKKGGIPKRLSLINDFCDVVRYCDLIDVGFSSDKFTWARNKREKETTKERLDHYFVNSKMEQKIRSVRVEHLNYHHSDHRPILLEIGWDNLGQQENYSKKNIKLEDCWTDLEGSKTTFKNSWNHSIEAFNVSFSRKIQEGLEAMSRWNKERLKGTIKGVITRKEKDINTLMNSSNPNRFDNIIQAELELEKLLEEEERYWKIRSREDWLKSGDKNTKWFHSKASQRRRKNEIKGILNSSGKWIEKEEEIGKIATSFFQDLLKSNQSSCDNV